MGSEGNDDVLPLPGANTEEGEILREAFRAFDAGDFRQVREHTSDLEDAEDADVRVAAGELARRVSIDPVQIGVVLTCAGVLAWIFVTWIV